MTPLEGSLGSVSFFTSVHSWSTSPALPFYPAPDPSPNVFNLWASPDGPLAKLDRLRGVADSPDDSDDSAVAHERRPAMSWLLGGSPSGYWLPGPELCEDDAERTTGVDLDASGELEPFVSSWPFLDEIMGGRRRGGSSRSSAPCLDVRSWGSCDAVATAVQLFAAFEPKGFVVRGGVNFTANDVKALLAVVADSAAEVLPATPMSSREQVGDRFEPMPDTVVLRDGTRFDNVQIVNLIDPDDFVRAGPGCFRWLKRGGRIRSWCLDAAAGGDQHNQKDIEIVPFGDNGDNGDSGDNGGHGGTVPASRRRILDRNKIAFVEHASPYSLSPRDFHEAVLRWNGRDREAFAMDTDPSSDVWNEVYHSVHLEQTPLLWKRVAALQPRGQLVGHRGPCCSREALVTEWRATLFATTHDDIDDAGGAGSRGSRRQQPSVSLVDTDGQLKDFAFYSESRRYRYFLSSDGNSGWLGDDRPDFLWRQRPVTFRRSDQQGEKDKQEIRRRSMDVANPRNPHVELSAMLDLWQAMEERSREPSANQEGRQEL